MYKLFLDDKREPWDDSWVHVKNEKEFKSYIRENGIPEKVSYDHDLHEEHYRSEMYSNNPLDYNKFYDYFNHGTGLDCAKWLCNYCTEKGFKQPETQVHSANPIGARNIAFSVMSHILFFEEEEIDVPIIKY